MNKQTLRRQYLEPLITALIDGNKRVDEMAHYLNSVGTKDNQHNNWHQPAIEAYLDELGFPFYAHTHQPVPKQSMGAPE
jgi:hypothetical protein